MNIALVGCGFVFANIHGMRRLVRTRTDDPGVYDLNPERSAKVSAYYGFDVYPSYEALLADPHGNGHQPHQYRLPFRGQPAGVGGRQTCLFGKAADHERR